MRKDPIKLCSTCQRLISFSYEIDSTGDYRMEVECFEFKHLGYIMARDKDTKCIGYIPDSAIPKPHIPIPNEIFIKENEMTL